jgi:hypothetical protein
MGCSLALLSSAFAAFSKLVDVAHCTLCVLHACVLVALSTLAVVTIKQQHQTSCSFRTSNMHGVCAVVARVGLALLTFSIWLQVSGCSGVTSSQGSVAYLCLAFMMMVNILRITSLL